MVEKEIDELLQAHLSMLENGNRALSESRRDLLFELYASELNEDQIRAIVQNF